MKKHFKNIKDFILLKWVPRITILLVVYIWALFASNLLWWKLIPLPFLERWITIAIIMVPIMFLVTDIVWDVYGKAKAFEFVKLWFFSLILLLIRQIIWVWINWFVPAWSWAGWYELYNESYSMVFGLSISFTIASIVAYLIGQRVDVFVFHLLKAKHWKKKLWVRNNISTAIAQFVDTFIWTVIAFSPRMISWDMWFVYIFSAIIIPYWIAKVIIAGIDTPLVYLWVNWLKKSEDIKKIK